ncbi:MAG: hypothetical protein HUU55_13555 [Myxococcales bacterium]|nr:hypothetical protein [Myxococcales bacterium]
MSRIIDQYLTHYAESLANMCGPELNAAYSAAVVVVAFDEGDELLTAVESLIAAAHHCPRALVIVVVNGFDEASDAAHTRNEASLAALTLLGQPVELPAVASSQLVVRRMEAADLWILDYATIGRRIPAGEGVGRARKIGCDLALQLWRQKQIESPWIRTTDADAVVPLAYFDKRWEQEAEGCSAWVYPFLHVPCGDTEERGAIAKYDGYLRYYVAGLKWAGSVYDFCTIGSTISVHVQAYAAVRGFPRRNAAEDFYILDKLRKVGPIKTVSSPAIVLSGRPSHRVPFGTGRAVSKIARDLKNSNEYLVENPLAFVALRAVLCNLTAMGAAVGKSPELIAHLWDKELAHNLSCNDDKLLCSTTAAIETLGAKRAVVDAARRVKTPDAFGRRITEWFDAFRTLKFLHLLREYGIDDVSYEAAVASCPFVIQLPPEERNSQ